MKKRFALTMALLAIVLGCSTQRRVTSQAKKPESQATPSPSDSRAADAVKGLKEKLLTSSAKDLGLSGKDAKARAWAVLMEVGLPEAVSTIMSIRDGTASLYTSTGGGILGGYSAQEQAKRFVVEADKHVAGMEPTKAFPYPDVGRIKFYVLTKDGVYTADAGEDELVNGQHGLSPLFWAGNDVITGLRIASEQMKPSAKP